MPHLAGSYITAGSQGSKLLGHLFCFMHSKLLISPLDMVNCCTLIFSRLFRVNKRIEDTLQHVEIATQGSDKDSIKSCSGPAYTHDTLAKTAPMKVGPRVAHTEQFLCKGGVDARRLVDLSRKGLYSTAKTMGGNVLLEEQ